METYQVNVEKVIRITQNIKVWCFSRRYWVLDYIYKNPDEIEAYRNLCSSLLIRDSCTIPKLYSSV